MLIKLIDKLSIAILAMSPPLEHRQVNLATPTHPGFARGGQASHADAVAAVVLNSKSSESFSE